MDNINSELRPKTGLQQWRNSASVIYWFKNLHHTERSKFLTFDIVDFYPSISEKLLTDPILFIKQHIDIDDDSIAVIYHCRKSLLFNKDGAWIKNNGSLFDVMMDSYGGAEICEIVGLFLLHHLSQLIGKNSIGLCRDNGLASLDNASGPSSERMRKRLITLFQDQGLKVTTKCNFVQTDFLDITFNLKSKKYWSFREPNNQPLYIHSQSNHPPVIKKQLPSMLSNLLPQLSCNQEEFATAIPEHEAAMRKSEYSVGLQYINIPGSCKRKRKRNIVWFNPPYSEHVKTNIGHEFLRLLTKRFPPAHRLHKICNKNNVKVSYSCMLNRASIISRHNKILLDNRAKSNCTIPPGNCRDKANCPLEGRCRQSFIVYKAAITSGGAAKHYHSCSETEFKAGFCNHNQSFKYRHKSNSTELSKAVWQAKDAGEDPNMKGNIMGHPAPYQSGASTCNLCLTEKLYIFQADPSTTLNKPSELNTKCRQTNKFKLKNLSQCRVLN